MKTELKTFVKDVFQNELEGLREEFPDEIGGLNAISDLALRKVESIVEPNEEKILAADPELAKKEIAIASRFYLFDILSKWYKEAV